jgi:hypothetical protein
MIKSYNDLVKENKELDKKEDDELIEVENTNEDEFDSITLSDKLQKKLKHIKKSENNKIEIGDKVFLSDDRKGRLNDEIYDYIIKKEVFDVLNINKNGKLDLGYYKYYIRTSDNTKVRKIFYFSPQRFKNLNNLNNVSSFFMSLKNIKKSNLIDNLVDYIDIDEKGNFSYLSRRFYEEGVDPFTSKRRQSGRLNRILNKIVTTEYYNTLTQQDIEIFLNKWRVLFDDSFRIEILQGKNILDAYNTELLAPGFSYSCANYTPGESTKKYDVYVNNPDNIKCVVVYHKDKIYARSMLFEGTQVETYGKFKKGNHVRILNYMYGVGGRGSKSDQLIKKWAEENNSSIIGEIDNSTTNVFMVEIKDTKFKMYPPWDEMYVNFKLNQIASNIPRKMNNSDDWIRTYSAVYYG